MPTEDASAEARHQPRQRDGLCCRSFDGEAVLYDPAHNTVHYLNKTAYFIWSRCNGSQGIPDIAGELASVFDVSSRGEDFEAAVHDVRHTLAELKHNGLIDLAYS